MRPSLRWIDRSLVACVSLLALVPAGADLLPSVRSRLDERQFLRPPGVPEDALLESSGAVLGEIRFVRINVFDPTIDADDAALFRLANRVHIVSRESTVAAQLLFRSGDRYDARVIKESERLLRSHDYLRDARIRPVSFHDGTVDVEVITEDTWTLKPEVQFGRKGGKNSSGFGVEEHNLFGTGGHLGVKSKTDVDRRSTLIEYGDANFAGSRWQVAAQHASNSDGHAQALGVARPFYALDSRWAAGVSLRNDKRVDSIYDFGSVVERFETHEREVTAYAGWSPGLGGRWVTRWTGGVTVDERHAGSLVSANPAARLPADRKLVYPWIGAELIEDDFRETRNQDQIGRPEDLALGWRAKVRLGYATPGFGSDRRAAIFAASAAKGVQPSGAHTLLWTATATGRLADGALEDAVFGVATRFYWRQTPRSTLFIGMSADQGVNLDVDRQLTLGGDNGLRGYPLRYRTGQGRWLLTVEERAFTDWYPFRLFNIGGALFYDMGGTWGSSIVPAAAPPPSPRGKVLKDVGFGLRVGNSRSALGNVVHVDIAFPIDGDPAVRRLQLVVEAKRSF